MFLILKTNYQLNLISTVFHSSILKYRFHVLRGHYYFYNAMFITLSPIQVLVPKLSSANHLDHYLVNELFKYVCFNLKNVEFLNHKIYFYTPWSYSITVIKILNSISNVLFQQIFIQISSCIKLQCGNIHSLIFQTFLQFLSAFISESLVMQ